MFLAVVYFPFLLLGVCLSSWIWGSIFFFALGTVWPLSLQLRLQTVSLHYCFQLHAPWVSGTAFYTFCHFASLWREADVDCWDSAGEHCRGEAHGISAEHRQPCCTFPDSNSLLPCFGWLQTFQSLIWTRKGNLSLKGNWRTTPYWWAPLQGPLHTCSLTTSMESVHCQGFVARGKSKGRSRLPNNSYYIGGPWSSQVVLVIKNPPSNAGDIREAGSVLGLERSPGEHGNPLQFSCLENPMDRGAWQVTVHGITESQTWRKWLSRHAHGVLTMSQALGSLLDMHYYPLTIPQLGTSISMLRQGN